MNFSFLCTRTFEDSIEIEDIGNCCIDALNDSGDEYFLIVETDLGASTITECGPFMVDSGPNMSYFYFSRSYRPFKEQSIKKVIDKFLNDEKKEITQVFLIDKWDVKDKIKGAFLDGTGIC